jgi:hypothetical protein
MCPICKWDCLPVDLRRERNELLQQRQQNHQTDATTIDMNGTVGPSSNEPPQHVENVEPTTTAAVSNNRVIPPPTLLPSSSPPPSPPHIHKEENPFDDENQTSTISHTPSAESSSTATIDMSSSTEKPSTTTKKD